MSLLRKNKQRKQRRASRVRGTIKRTSTLPRVSVFKSAKHMYAQLIDDVAQKTLASCSSMEMKNLAGDKKAVAHAIGLELAERSKKAGITAVTFDRGSFLYHGRVQALAQGLREGGLAV